MRAAAEKGKKRFFSEEVFRGGKNVDEIKSMLQAILSRLEEQGAEIKGLHERMERMEGRLSELREEQEGVEKRIHARFSVMQKQHLEYEAWAKDLTRHIESFRDDIRLIVQRLGEHEHEIRKLQTK
mgnify:CR=1 FL=1